MILVLTMTVLVTALTWLVGWGAVPAIAVIVGYWRPEDDGLALRVAASAALAWALLLVVDLASGPLVPLGRMLAGVMKLPAPVLILLTLAFPALLGWSGAVVGAAVRALTRAKRDRGATKPAA